MEAQVEQDVECGDDGAVHRDSDGGDVQIARTHLEGWHSFHRMQQRREVICPHQACGDDGGDYKSAFRLFHGRQFTYW
jgi:hypothetical protein